jgi:CheY-like chemotaxis protein
VRHYLLVDDNEAFAENLAEIIRDLGDEVTIAVGGEQALARVRERKFDALITDMRMPVMSGADLVHAIRHIDSALPAIVITAYTTDDDIAAARREGLLGVLPKPVPVERLLKLLSLARRHALIAVVEDDLSMSDNLCEALRDRGFSAVTATSVLETERLGPVFPCAGLVDLRVTGGGAGEAMKKLAQKFPGLPLFVITAFAEEQPPVAYEKMFIKPFNTGELLSAIEATFQRAEKRS